MILLLLFGISNLGCTGSGKSTGQPQGAYRAPGYVKKDYKQLIVYARLQNPAYRQKLENAVADFLNKRGYHTMPAYKNIDMTTRPDSVEFFGKINELKVDGLVALDYLRQTTGVQDSYRYNGGMYNYFYGCSSPFDLETTARQQGYMRLDFYNLDARGTQYNTILPVKLFNGFDEAVKQLAEDCYTRLKSDRII